MDYPRSTGAIRESLDSAAAVCPPATAVAAAPAVPAYLRDSYHWAYLDAANARFLDREIVVRTILWWQHKKLQRTAFAEIEAGQHVLQAACVYGQFSTMLAQHIGADGQLEIVDVAEVQVRNCRNKLRRYPHATVSNENVLHLHDRSVDIALSYFLLHELPDDYKTGAMHVLLDCVKPGGKAVFVDYHKPHWAHPLKPVTSLVFDTLEPYAKELWRNEIADYAGNDPRFSWSKETYFGGLYQKVVATRLT